jgi:ubiquinone/menaquinone biosynthesis C-methylase UbiE
MENNMNNIYYEIANREYKTINGIIYFVPEDELEINIEYANQIITGNLIEKNWREHKLDNIYSKQAASKIIDRGGLILEIGTGPGGGFVPYILQLDKNANIIISDLCPTVCIEWKKLFEKEYFPPNVTYTAMDHCDIPFINESIDIVSSSGGFVNTEGDKLKALKEIYRVLKKGGIYIDSGIAINMEHFSTLPPKVRQEIKRKFESATNDFLRESYEVGFTKIENIDGEKWSNKDDDSRIADLCRELGVYLIFNTYIRYCYK